MAAAFILAGELYLAAGNHDEAFQPYESLFAPFVGDKQKAALRLAGFFAPKSRVSLFVRNQLMNLLTIPWVSDVVLTHDFADNIEIPDY